MLTKNGGGDRKRRLSRVHCICTMHCVQCTLEKQCTANHVINIYMYILYHHCQTISKHRAAFSFQVSADQWFYNDSLIRRHNDCSKWLIHYQGPHLLRWINSLWPSDAIWRHISGSTLIQVMACCLTAPSHYLNQCWVIISTDQWLYLRATSQEIPQPSVTKISFNKISFKSPRGQWVNFDPRMDK